MSEPTTLSTGQRRAIRFGIFDWLDERRPLEMADLYEERLRFLEYADSAGYYCYHLAEHHWTPLCMAPSPNLFLAAAAQRTRRIRLGPLVYLLPLYNPLRLMGGGARAVDHPRMARKLSLYAGQGVGKIERIVSAAERFEELRKGLPVSDAWPARAPHNWWNCGTQWVPADVS